MPGSADEDSSSSPKNMNRRPSELNAATDLAGLRVPKVDADEIDPKSNSASKADDLKKSPTKKDISTKTEPHDEANGEPSSSSSGSKKEEPVTVPVSTVPDTNNKKMSNAEENIKQEADTTSAKQGSSSSSPAAAAAVVPATAADAAAASGDEPPEGEKTAFPILLHEIVSEPSTDDCVHWLSCGTRFMISDKKKFAKDVLPRFYGHAKFTSFTRRLKRWSFTRVPSGPFMGAYYNPNFRRGEPELAARVRYDHPTPLSGAAMQLNKAKLQALGGVGGAGLGALGFMGGMGGLSDQDRDALLRQMNFMGGMGGLGGGMNPNLAATNNNVALQMAMAQEMMNQQRNQQLAAQMGNLSPLDQARLLQQQQQLAALGQQGAAAGGDQQNLLQAMLARQQGQVGSNPNLQGGSNPNLQGGSNPNLQQPQTTQGGNTANAQFQVFQGSMPSLASLTASSSLASTNPSGLGFNLMGQNGSGQQPNQAQNTSGGSIAQQAGLMTGTSNGSLTTLPGGKPQGNANANTANGQFAPQLNFNSPNLGVGAMGGGQLPGATPGNPTAMNALLADYLRRTSGAPNAAAGGAPGDNNNGKGASC